ncbi:hypothetical protein J560_4258 [Acinetobacter baumannii 855125]|nr:hypothetical protein J560_4258 [Acinetobacter baumannii 855125]
MCQAQSLWLCCAFFSPKKGTGFFIYKQQEFITVKLCEI